MHDHDDLYRRAMLAAMMAYHRGLNDVADALFRAADQAPGDPSLLAVLAGSGFEPMPERQTAERSPLTSDARSRVPQRLIG